jgi:multisubunit Na+/H+ antiporter MnhC subunit
MMQAEKPYVLEPAGIDERFARRPVWLPVLIIAAFVILLFCASPRSDDFCFAATFRDLGLMAMIRDLYLTFQGRLFSFVAVSAPFFVHDTVGGDLLMDFRAFCAAALGATLALALWAGHVLLPACARPIRLLLGCTTAVVLVAGSPEPEDIFYWATGIGFYTIAALFSLWLMLWLHRQAARAAPLHPVMVALLAAAAMTTATATEITGPVLIVIVLGALLHRWLLSDTPLQPLAHAVILCAIAIGIAVVVLSPGNAIRMRSVGTDQGMALRALTGLPLGIGHVAQFLVRRLTNPALLAWIVLLMLAAPARDPGPADTPPTLRRLLVVWLPLATAMTAIYGSLWIGHVATGRLLEQRALDYLHFVLVGGSSLTVIAASAVYSERMRGAIKARWPAFDRTKLAAAALLLMLATPHFLQAVRILPQVGALRRLAEERFAQLGDGKIRGAPIADRELVLPALSTEPIPWFGDPVSDDPTAWSNDCVARYVGTRSVRTATPPTFP